MAHDLRNPLGAIKNATYLLKNELVTKGVFEGNAKLNTCIEIIDNQVNKSNQSITDLMDFAKLKEAEVEAVAVCLLWSIVNSNHENRVGELLDEHLPGVPYTLSHILNPSLREYRRASSAAIDASLKPLMPASPACGCCSRGW